jgi:hypothetical protein
MRLPSQPPSTQHAAEIDEGSGFGSAPSVADILRERRRRSEANCALAGIMRVARAGGV